MYHARTQLAHRLTLQHKTICYSTPTAALGAHV